MPYRHFSDSLREHLEVMSALHAAEADVENVGRAMGEILEQGGKLLVCGNGGSASDSQHFVAELVGRFEADRPALSAIALTVDGSVLTAVGNDFDFEQIFCRQVRALGRRGDGLLAISTSGRSKNVLAALAAAREIGLTNFGLSGESIGPIDTLCDYTIKVPSRRTARIQEAHGLILHVLCETIEEFLTSTNQRKL